MGKLIGRFVLFLLPILVVVGVFRYAVHGFDPDNIAFLPTWPELVSYWASAPDAVDLISNSYQTFINAWSPDNFAITDFVSFFTAIGAFFNGIGQVFVFLWNVLSLPWAYVIWFISFLAGYDITPGAESTGVFLAMQNAPFMPLVGLRELFASALI